MSFATTISPCKESIGETVDIESYRLLVHSSVPLAGVEPATTWSRNPTLCPLSYKGVRARTGIHHRGFILSRKMSVSPVSVLRPNPVSLFQVHQLRPLLPREEGNGATRYRSPHGSRTRTPSRTREPKSRVSTNSTKEPYSYFVRAHNGRTEPSNSIVLDRLGCHPRPISE